jgi:YidC/Oxa1 family membrane protein insertase
VAQVPGTPATPLVSAATAPRDRIEVATDVLKLTFDTEGGSLVRSEFSQHADMADHSKPLVLLDESRDRVYVAQTGLIGATNGVAYATHKTPMTFSGERAVKDGQNELTVRFESASNW